MYSLEANINRPDINPSVANATRAQDALLRQRSQYWIAAWSVAYSIEFTCLIVAKLLVLDRLVGFVRRGKAVVPKKVLVGGKIIVALVAVVCGAGMCGNAIVAHIRKVRGDLHYSAAVAYAANDIDAGNSFTSQALQQAALANRAVSVQQFCEVAVLLVIITVFVVVGIMTTHRVRSAFKDLNNLDPGRRTVIDALAFGSDLLLRTRCSIVIVFLSFLLRAVFAIMNALGDQFQNVGASCAASASGPCDASCYNVWTLMGTWMFFTPGFRLVVELISFPVTLLAALWSMTTKSVRKLMASTREVVEVSALVDGSSAFSLSNRSTGRF
jgi:hypothetical protein